VARLALKSVQASRQRAEKVANFLLGVAHNIVRRSADGPCEVLRLLHTAASDQIGPLVAIAAIVLRVGG
jgi:hypothetical protein